MEQRRRALPARSPPGRSRARRAHRRRCARPTRPRRTAVPAECTTRCPQPSRAPSGSAAPDRARAPSSQSRRASRRSSGTNRLGGCTRATRHLWIVSASVFPTKRRSLVSSSQNTIIAAYVSVRRLTGSPRTCSGAMYAYFPFTALSRVEWSLPAALAMPKSTRRATPSAPTRMFCGETSRCTRPRGPPFSSVLRGLRGGRGGCR